MKSLQGEKDKMQKIGLAAYIDHTLLAATATPADIKRLATEGNKHRFASLCVNGCQVALAKSYSEIPITAVVGFPLGAMTTASKALEAAQAYAHGASEIDMVINLGWAKAGMWRQVEEEISEVLRAVPGALLKVIIETVYLTDEEKRRACLAAEAGGAHFVKTSSGFAGGGATLEDVRLMRQSIGSTVGVKAAGGIKDLATALAFIAAGANRLGVSAGVKIMKEFEAHGNQL